MHGLSHFNVLGPSIFFPTDLIQHVINCAHVHKITDLDSLYRATHWRKDWVDIYGPSLLEILHEYHTLPPPFIKNDPHADQLQVPELHERDTGSVEDHTCEFPLFVAVLDFAGTELSVACPEGATPHVGAWSAAAVSVEAAPDASTSTCACQPAGDVRSESKPGRFS